MLGFAAPAAAQLPALPLPDLPAPPDETGPITDVLDGLVDQISDGLADVPYANTLQLLGQDPIDAAVALSEATFDTSRIALIARADLFADSLSSGATQGATGAPLLLTHTNRLDDRTARELQRLRASRVYVIGWESALAPAVQDQLRRLGLVTTRVGGDTRIETAIALAELLQPDATKAVVARGWGGDASQTFADALTVGPRAAENEWPILLSHTDRLTDSLVDYLKASRVREVEIVGGPAAITPAVESQLQGLGITTTRVAGANRADTAVEIAKARGIPTPEDLTRVILAEGYGDRPVWAPGFAAAAHGAVNGAPIVLSDRARLPNETVEYLVSGHPRTNLTTLDPADLLEASPVLLCASFVDPVACQAASLLLLAKLPEATDLLGLDLGSLPLLAELIDLLDGVLDGLLGGVPLDELPDGALTELVGALPDLSDPDLLDPDLPDPDLLDPDLPDPDLLDPDLPDPDLLDPDLLDPDLLDDPLGGLL